MCIFICVSPRMVGFFAIQTTCRKKVLHQEIKFKLNPHDAVFFTICAAVNALRPHGAKVSI